MEVIGTPTTGSSATESSVVTADKFEISNVGVTLDAAR